MCAIFSTHTQGVCFVQGIPGLAQARAVYVFFFVSLFDWARARPSASIASAGQFGFSCRCWRGWVRPQQGLLISCCRAIRGIAVAAPPQHQPQHCFLVFHWLLLFFTCCSCCSSSAAECPEKQQPLFSLSYIIPLSFYFSAFVLVALVFHSPVDYDDVLLRSASSILSSGVSFSFRFFSFLYSIFTTWRSSQRSDTH